jgi:hypothetical protein
MSTRETGNARERTFERRLWEHGFRTARFSGSGTRVSDGRKENGLCGDLVALAPMDSGLPHIIVEVGGIGKRLAVAFAELAAQPLPPGFVPCIARCVARRWWFYTSPDDRFADFADFIAALRAI